jgi:hypothetical protein
MASSTMCWTTITTTTTAADLETVLTGWLSITPDSRYGLLPNNWTTGKMLEKSAKTGFAVSAGHVPSFAFVASTFGLMKAEGNNFEL